MHLLSTSQFRDRSELDALFATTNRLAKPHLQDRMVYQARGKVLGIVKDEGSTRTRLSFEVAMKRLGGEVLLLDLDKQFAP